MITVLGEYKVEEEKRGHFLTLLPQLQGALEEMGARDISFFEGADQPGLFVEEFQVATMQDYERIKAARYAEQSRVWVQLHSCIRGGKDKVHLWAFSRLAVKGSL